MEGRQNHILAAAAGEALRASLVDLLGLLLTTREAFWELREPDSGPLRRSLAEALRCYRRSADRLLAGLLATGDEVPAGDDGDVQGLHDQTVLELIATNLDAVLGRARSRRLRFGRGSSEASVLSEVIIALEEQRARLRLLAPEAPTPL